MSGPAISSGSDSRQDYGTPVELIRAVEDLLDTMVVFDLAAHRLNKRHARYFAPDFFVEKYDPTKPFDARVLVDELAAKGANWEEASALVHNAQAGGVKTEIKVRNHDADHQGFDAFKQDWAALSAKYLTSRTHHTVGHPGLLWLNCEFSDIGPWAKKCAAESENGAHIALLVPASVGAVWLREHVARKADIRFLTDRVCFDGKNVFPKDCMVAHFYPGAAGTIGFWSWRKGREFGTWRESRAALGEAKQGRLFGAEAGR